MNKEDKNKEGEDKKYLEYGTKEFMDALLQAFIKKALGIKK